MSFPNSSPRKKKAEGKHELGNDGELLAKAPNIFWELFFFHSHSFKDEVDKPFRDRNRTRAEGCGVWGAGARSIPHLDEQDGQLVRGLRTCRRERMPRYVPSGFSRGESH